MGQTAAENKTPAATNTQKTNQKTEKVVFDPKKSLTGLPLEKLDDLDVGLKASGGVGSTLEIFGNIYPKSIDGFNTGVAIVRGYELAVKATLVGTKDDKDDKEDIVENDKLEAIWESELTRLGIKRNEAEIKKLGGAVIQAIKDDLEQGKNAINSGKAPIYHARAKITTPVIDDSGKKTEAIFEVTGPVAFAAGVTSIINSVAVREEVKSEAPSIAIEEIIKQTNIIYTKPDAVSIVDSFGYGQELGESIINRYLPKLVKPATPISKQ